MSNPFDRLDRMASRAVDATFGEPYTLIPMKAAPNGPSRRDMDRDVITGKGVFTDAAEQNGGIQTGSSRSFGGRDNDFRTMRQGRRLELSVDRASFGVGLPKQGDEVEVRDRRFSVVSAEPDGQSRVVLKLSERT